MKTTNVPAQVTTVEDKIAGNLTLSQLLLLITPLFIGSAIYLVIPPTLHLTIIKCVISFLILIVFGLSAIRVKGKILLFWAIVVMRYVIRPRYYIFNKNDLYLRDIPNKQAPALDDFEDNQVVESPAIFTNTITTLEKLHLEKIMADPRAKLHFMTNRKGDLRVHITEVK